jgi:predicted DNA-binding transcriptional regulator AlpA
MTTAFQPSPRAMLTEPEAAEFLGCSTRTLQAWRQSGRGPAFIKLNGTMVRYPKPGLDTFIAAGERRQKLRGGK